jgi:hypothetical protein
MAIYETSNPGANLSFDVSYMEHVGFFIFQIVGFFVFIIIALYIFRRSLEDKYKKVLIFLIAGGIIELAFFLIVTEFEPAFLYSILDKVVAIAFAGIMYWASHPKKISKKDLVFSTKFP